ncbi:histidine kinase [Lapillicoccus sp.]|uniref:sensor histidine kinase n=1 Tax=Lapillicoccus sp. TaxID=1909287 RepID=UPI0025EA530E|nr:histidine kinase [Lapillicoccus sp.]
MAVVVAADGLDDGWRTWAALAFLAVFGVLVLGRRRFPVTMLVASVVALLLYYAAGLPPVGVALPVAASFYTIATLGRLRLAICIAAVLVAVSIGFRLFAEGDAAAAVLGSELVTTVALLAAAIALGDAARQRLDLAHEHEKNARLAANERERAVRRRADEERLRIPQDLHDSLGHGLTIVSLRAADALDGEDAALRGHLTQIRLASRRLLGDLRAAVSALRPAGDPRDVRGDLTTLERLAASSSVGGVRVRAVVAPRAHDEPLFVQHALFRVAQEAVTNALRHAGAATVTMTMTVFSEEGAVRVEIDDDGCGFDDSAGLGGAGSDSAGLGGAGLDDSAGLDGAGLNDSAATGAPTGAGIDGMRCRIELLGGWCRIDAGAGRGTRVSAGFDRDRR